MPDFSVPSWLIPPTQIQQAELNQQESAAVANQMLQQRRIGLEQAQQRALEAHRKIAEGIDQAQEARQQAIFSKTAANELSRRIGMKMVNDDLEIWHADNPEATPAQVAQKQTQAILQNADKIFPDGQGFAPFMQHATQAIGQVGVVEATIKAKNASAKASEATANLREAQATNEWLEPGTAGPKAYAPSNTERVIKEAEARGIKFSPSEVDEAFKVAAGIQPRERKATQELRGKFISEHLQKALEAEKDSPTGALSEGVLGHFRKPTPKSRDEIVKELGALYDTIYGSPTEGTSAPASPAPAGKKLIFDPATGSFSPGR